MEENIWDHGLAEKFLDVTPWAQSIKENTNKLNFIKFKNFCFVKDSVKRMKR